jgi:hypothetical protein
VEDVVVWHVVEGNDGLERMGGVGEITVRLVVPNRLEEVGETKPERYEEQDINSEPVEGLLLLPEVPVLFDFIRGFRFSPFRTNHRFLSEGLVIEWTLRFIFRLYTKSGNRV